MIEIEYNSNNSGGSWWLTDEDWWKLENAGWNVKWASHEKPSKDCEYCKGTGKFLKTEQGICSSYPKGTRCFYCLYSENGRYLGALAKSATLKCNSITEALQSFEKVTGQSVTDEGCNCCGSPHSFDWNDEKGEYNYCSGEECLHYLYPDKKIPSSLRELMEAGQ